jgi:hypothetical protein
MKTATLLLSAAAFSLGLHMSATHAGTWQSTASLNTTRGAAGIIEVDGRLYVIGGVDGWRFLGTSEYTQIQADGQLAAWQKGPSLNEDRGFFGVAQHNGYVYAVGGGNGPHGHNLLRSVERAKLLPGGGLGPWQQESTQLNLPRRCAKVIVTGDFLYAFGGFGGTLLDTIERARINGDGSLGPWELLPDTFTIARYIHAMAHHEGALYAIGGHAEQGGTGIASVEYSVLQPNGALAKWQAGPPLKQGRYGLAAATHGGYVYAIGGLSGANFYDAIERSPINADGSLGEWQSVSNLPAPFADVGIATHGDWIYLIGGTNRDGYYDSVFYARFADLAAPAVEASAATRQISPAPKPSKPVLMPNEGIVAEVIDGGTYIYVSIDLGDGQSEWLATGKSDINVGDHVRYSPGIFMQNFYSKTLQRTFDIIRFVGKLEKAANSNL